RLLFQLQKIQLGDDYIRRRGARVRTALDRVLDELGALFLAPLAEHIAGRKLVFVPYGILHGLPIHAFRLAGRYLVETPATSYAPSMTVLARRRDRVVRDAGRIAAVAESEATIPDVLREVTELQRLYGKRCERLDADEFRRRIAALSPEFSA